MSRGALALLACACALALLLAPRGARAQVLSPGPLSAAHGNLDSDDDCGKCHQSGSKIVPSLCLGCHKDLGAKIATSSGLHGRQYKGRACEECHVEHLGKNAKLVRWPGGDPSKLDHALTGWPLAGAHKPVTCGKCHTQTSPLGKAQFLGAKTACASCHKDPHAGRFTGECKKCHGEVEWKTFERTAFDHGLARFPLTGKHVDVACTKCHGTPEKWTPIAFATCDACHADPHKGEFKPKPCTACHDTKDWAGAGDKIKSNHPWLSLRNGHAPVACKTCHDKGDDKPPSKGKTCIGCHKPIHVAKFGPKCESCHASIQWVGLPDAVGRQAHGQTRYPLAGKHVDLACGACHSAKKPVAARYRQLSFAACTSCHADPHAGEFTARRNGECGQCHTVAGFAPATFGVAEHATTAFGLDGRHVATRCSGCHTKARPWLDLRVGKSTCLECHANPHGTQFAKEMAGGGCATCHTTADWHQARIDHSTWPLVGAHQRTACTACHGEQTVGAPPAAYRGIPKDCEGCHDDIHAGQFRLGAPVAGCASCHDARDRGGFRIAGAFDHAKKTTYPLVSKHAQVACAGCHPTATLRNGVTAVRYRLGYRACKDCHANPHVEAP